MLQNSLKEGDYSSRDLGAVGVTKSETMLAEEILNKCLNNNKNRRLSALERVEYLQELNDWLVNKKLDQSYADDLADSLLSLKELNEFTEKISEDKLNIVFKWLSSNLKIYTLVNEIDQAARKIYKLVNVVKRFTYMDNLTQKEIISVESGINDTLSVLESKIKIKKAQIELKIEPDLPFVIANGSELNQVWFCLIDNALDAIQESGKILIKACCELDRVIVQIIDNGQGIEPKLISKIFDPFFTTKPAGSGTGLGLDISHRIVRRYDGDIAVKSKPGHTEFCVSLMQNHVSHKL